MESSQSSLVERARAGARDAFGDLVTIYQNEIYAYALRITGDAEAASDVTQDVFVRAYTSLMKLRDAGKFRPWLYAIAVNRCRTWLKQQHRRSLAMSRSLAETATEALGNDRELADPHPSASPDLAVSQEELRQRVQEALGSLAPKYREVAVLRFEHELKVSQIAEALGLRVAAVESRLRRAKEMLRTKLSGLL